MKRNLAMLTSTKPSFVPPDDYHRFSSVVADRDAEALVVRSPALGSHQRTIAHSILRRFLPGTKTICVISKIDQAASNQKALAAVQALLLN
ncbi:dynamin-2A-like [Castanea sativa]|uniref:dynamin-2A-like n=1 Tax=Castanea sativa TaxID=21020 RepID=UPI003F650A91